MMQVEVRLFAVFREGRFSRKTLDLSAGTTLGDLLDQLSIPREDVSVPLVNGRYSEMERELATDDVVAVFPAIGGG